MKNIEETETVKFPLDIQFFAEPGEGDNNGEGDDNKGDKGTDPNGGEPKDPKTIAELIASNPNYQSEYDKKVQEGIATAKANWEKDQKNKVDILANEKLTEKEKLAKMNDTEKAQYEMEKREKAIADREAELTLKELNAEARTSLAEKELPLEFAGLINYTDAESVKTSIDTLKKVWDEELQKASEKLAKGNKVPNAGKTATDQRQAENDAFLEMGNGLGTLKI